MYIVKPLASSRGRGIRLVTSLAQLPHRGSRYRKCIVQRYVQQPLLIHGYKWDMRVSWLGGGRLVAGLSAMFVLVLRACKLDPRDSPNYKPIENGCRPTSGCTNVGWLPRYD